MRVYIDALANASDLVSFLLITPEIRSLISDDDWDDLKDTVWWSLTGALIPWLCGIAILLAISRGVGAPMPWQVTEIQTFSIGALALTYAILVVPVFGSIGYFVGRVKFYLDARVQHYRRTKQILFWVGAGLFTITRLVLILEPTF
jgi:hypothetical protein